MPSWVPVWIEEGIWWVFPSRMRLRMAHGRHHDLERGHPALLVLRREQELRDHALERLGQLHAHLLLLVRAGTTSMMRSIVFGALVVCSVAKTRWPVSAAVARD